MFKYISISVYHLNCLFSFKFQGIFFCNRAAKFCDISGGLHQEMFPRAFSHWDLHDDHMYSAMPYHQGLVPHAGKAIQHDLAIQGWLLFFCSGASTACRLQVVFLLAEVLNVIQGTQVHCDTGHHLQKTNISLFVCGQDGVHNMFVGGQPVRVDKTRQVEV